MRRHYDHSEVVRISGQRICVEPDPEGDMVALCFVDTPDGSRQANRNVIQLYPGELTDLVCQAAEFVRDNPDLWEK